MVNLSRANFLELNTDRGVNVWENSLGSNYGVGSWGMVVAAMARWIVSSFSLMEAKWLALYEELLFVQQRGWQMQMTKCDSFASYDFCHEFLICVKWFFSLHFRSWNTMVHVLVSFALLYKFLNIFYAMFSWLVCFERYVQMSRFYFKIKKRRRKEKE